MITAEFLRTLDNDELHARTVRAARSERKIMHLVLLHIREVERRMLYVVYECASIKQYCIKELKYSESAANRRMQAARLLDLLPEISDSVQSGALNLTTLTVVQSVLRAEEKRSGEKIHIEDKREILAYLENKTTDQALRTLAQAFPDAQPPVEKTRPLADDKTQVSFVMPKSLAQKLERVRELESHKHGHLGWAELFEIIADFYLERRAPEMKPVRKKSTKKEKPQARDSTPSSQTSIEVHSSNSVETAVSSTDVVSSNSIKTSDANVNANASSSHSTKTEALSTMNPKDSHRTSQFIAQESALQTSTHSTPSTKTTSHRATVAASSQYKNESSRAQQIENQILEQTKSIESLRQEREEIAPSKNVSMTAESEPKRNSGQARTLRRRKKHSVSVQRLLHLRSGSQCEHVDPATGLRCTRRFHLQIDHVQAFSRGGSDEIENLQLLCRAHNLKKGHTKAKPMWKTV